MPSRESRTHVLKFLVRTLLMVGPDQQTHEVDINLAIKGRSWSADLSCVMMSVCMKFCHKRSFFL